MSGVPLDKLSRIIRWDFGDDVEFLHIACSISNNFEIDPTSPQRPEFIAELVTCSPADRDVNTTDRFRYMKKIQFLTDRGAAVEGYGPSEAGGMEWGSGFKNLSAEQLALIAFSPDYPTLTDFTFSDWMYQGLVESADVLLGIRPSGSTGGQDWHQIFATQDGTEVTDSEGNTVSSPVTGLTYKTGTSTQLSIKARRYTSGPICTDNNLDPGIEEANLTGTIGGEETAHTINCSFAGLTIDLDDGGSGELSFEGQWQAFAFSVSPDQNAQSIDILLQRTNA